MLLMGISPIFVQGLWLSPQDKGPKEATFYMHEGRFYHKSAQRFKTDETAIPLYNGSMK